MAEPEQSLFQKVADFATANGGWLGALAGGGGVALISWLSGGSGWTLALLALGGVAAGGAAGFVAQSERAQQLGLREDPARQAHLDAQERFLSGLYLDRNPEVRERLLSGEAERRGQYTSAREHYERFGQAEGKPWTLEEYAARGITLPVGMPTTNHRQPCEYAHIPCDANNRVTLNEGQFLQQLASRNRGIVFGDNNHSDPEIPAYLAQNIPAFAASGVKHVYLEINVSEQHHIDDYMRTGDASHLSFWARGYPHWGRIIEACRTHNIQVHCMDARPFDDIRVNRGFFNEGGFSQERNKSAANAGRTWAMYQRQVVNQHWVDTVRNTSNGERYILLGGSHHTRGYIGLGDIDEMLAEQTGQPVVYVDLFRGRNDGVHVQRTVDAAPTRPDYGDTPEFTVYLRSLHLPLYENLRANRTLEPAQDQRLRVLSRELVERAIALKAHVHTNLGNDRHVRNTSDGPYSSLLGSSNGIMMALCDGDVAAARARCVEMRDELREMRVRNPHANAFRLMLEDTNNLLNRLDEITTAAPDLSRLMQVTLQPVGNIPGFDEAAREALVLQSSGASAVTSISPLAPLAVELMRAVQGNDQPQPSLT